MKLIPASEGFLDYFKKKSKQPSKVETSKIEKSNINDAMTPGKPVENSETISKKLQDMYPDDAKKEFAYRTKMLKDLINILTEADCKFGKTPGIDFKYSINQIKLYLQGKELEDYVEYRILQDLLPSIGPKDEPYQWACMTGFSIDCYGGDIWKWAETGPYKDDFKSNKRLVRDFNDTAEWYDTINTIDKFIENKLKKYSDIIKPNIEGFLLPNYGDWDSIDIVIEVSPSKTILDLAARCSSYKNKF